MVCAARDLFWLFDGDGSPWEWLAGIASGVELLTGGFCLPAFRRRLVSEGIVDRCGGEFVGPLSPSITAGWEVIISFRPAS